MLANYVRAEGHILPNQYFIEGGAIGFYATTPFIHLSLFTFSAILGTPILFSFKLLPVLLSSIYPMLTYVIIKKFGFAKEKKVLRYALFVSCLPIEPALSYVITGSMFGLLLSFYVLTQLIKLSQNSNLNDWFLLVIFSCALITAHSFSALQLPLMVLGVMMIQKFAPFRIKSRLKAWTMVLILLLNLGWLAFQAQGTLLYMSRRIINLGILLGIYPETGVIPGRFFELANVNILDALKIMLVRNGADIFLLFFMAISIIFVFKKRKLNSTFKFLCLLNILLWLLLFFGVASGLAGYYWKRILRFLSISYSIFLGFFIVQMDQRIHGKKIRSAIFASLLIILMVLISIQVYSCQPIVSPANSLSTDLPEDEPLVYFVQVNSIYQREMIEFSENFVNGSIACDDVTRNQIIGLTDIVFSRKLAWYYPFSRLIYETMPEKEYEYFLIHLPGKSGGFEEQAEIRTRSLIITALNDSSVVYTNGESFVIVN
jgi:hypothetical protein